MFDLAQLKYASFYNSISKKWFFSLKARQRSSANYGFCGIELNKSKRMLILFKIKWMLSWSSSAMLVLLK